MILKNKMQISNFENVNKKKKNGLEDIPIEANTAAFPPKEVIEWSDKGQFPALARWPYQQRMVDPTRLKVSYCEHCNENITRATILSGINYS